MSETSPSGKLIVRVSAARGAVPIENATVIIQGKEPENEDIMLSLITNRDGLTDRVTLPAPSISLSQEPRPSKKPYSTYNIEVYKEGYYPQHYNGVPIFEGITAVQNAAIIPLSESAASAPYYTEGQVFEEYENPNLYKEGE